MERCRYRARIFLGRGEEKTLIASAIAVDDPLVKIVKTGDEVFLEVTSTSQAEFRGVVNSLLRSIAMLENLLPEKENL